MNENKRPTRQELDAILSLPEGTIIGEDADTSYLQGWTATDLRAAVVTESVGQLLKVARQEKGLTGEKAGEKLGFSKARVSQLEKMETPALQLQSLVEYAHALGYSLKIELIPDSGEGKTLATRL